MALYALYIYIYIFVNIYIYIYVYIDIDIYTMFPNDLKYHWLVWLNGSTFI